MLASSAGRDLTCAQVEDVEVYLELLAGRPLQHNGHQRLPRVMRARFDADPAAMEPWLVDLRARGRALEVASGMAAAALRAEAVWSAHAGQGIVREADGELWNIQRDALSVWAWSDEHRLALTEADIEGWLSYASLCREAQQGGVLRVSVADRVSAYRVVTSAFEAGSRDDKIALAAIGPFWHQVKDRWQSASYERQQRWIFLAPLPPPMTASSLGYFEAILNGDVSRHAAAVHDVLGPLSLNREAWRFDE